METNLTQGGVTGALAPFPCTLAGILFFRAGRWKGRRLGLA